MIVLLLLEAVETIGNFCNGLEEAIEFEGAVDLDVVEYGYDIIE